MRSNLFLWRLGKYREIVISIALFLVFDLGVLVMNFYISTLIQDDAKAVNLAGRQRMLSQRITKSLLQIERSGGDERDIQELQNAFSLFDDTLLAFQTGGDTKDGVGQPTFLAAAESPRSQSILSEAETLWSPFRQLMQPILGSMTPPMASVRTASDQIGQINLELLRLMNDLTYELESIASAKAQRLRLIQSIGITLALINFFIILFHFVRRLSMSDDEVEAARRETEEIMRTVSEGLFLLDADGRIGTQYSNSLEELLAESDLAGRQLHELLAGRVPERTLHTARDYITMLFQPHVRENLVRDLNPLEQIELHIQDEKGNYQVRYLTFRFKRVVGRDKALQYIQVTVNDISAQVKLAAELEESRRQADEQMDLMVKLLHISPELLRSFIDQTEASLEQINDLLRQRRRKSKEYRAMLEQIFVIVHGIKGEAGLVGLDFFESKAHAFEQNIVELRALPEIGGNELVGLTVRLKQLIETLTSVRDLVHRLGELSRSFEDVDTLPQTQLQQLVQRMAERQDKQIELSCALESIDLAPTVQGGLRDIAIQLLRNAVSHGIESPKDRVNAGKNACGRLRLNLKREGNDLVFSLRDDGRGIDPQRLRQAALDSGRYSEEDMRGWDERRLINLLFESGVSTAEQVDGDAGRGVGMEVVRQQVNRIGARLRLASQPGKGCEWRILLPLQSDTEFTAT